MIQVIFISESILKGKKRVNAVLDRYAKRIGNETWTTPITQEGLEVIKSTLKSIATKQTHISCFKKTPSGNKLIFSIGKSIYRENEAISVHKHKKYKKINVPQYIKDATILTKLAGLFHDLGKMSVEFQKKISLTEEQKNKDKSQLSDSVRHELISFYLFKNLEKNPDISFNEAWNISQDDINKHDEEFVNSRLSSWQDLVKFIIITHHKLPTNINANQNNKIFSIKSRNTLSNYFKNKEIPKSSIYIKYDRDSERQISYIIKEIRFILKRLKNRNFSENENYWFAMSYLCRSHFILSDHEQSSISLDYKNEVPKKGEIIYANTHLNNKNQKIYFNQTLNWHLKNVADRSSQLLFEINNIKYKGLNNETIKAIVSHTKHQRFYWQNKSIDYMTSLPENTQALILNIAGTGSGKTRSNVSTLASLNRNRNDNKPFRFSTLLNLKTLTLQTIDSYKEQLNILENEIVGVIGDLNTMALHNYSKENNEIAKKIFLMNDEINEEDFDEIDIISYDDIDTPEFLDIILDKKIIKNNKEIKINKRSKKSEMLFSPVLVSTIDFIINAGDISNQKKHSIALLRLMNSDLILDEIDSYEPKALVSVARIIMLSALFGNNIIASSATLSEPCAEMIFNAYKKGIEMRKSLINDNTILSKVIIIDDKIEVSETSIDIENSSFNSFYLKHLSAYLSCEDKVKKKAKIIKFEKTQNGIINAIKNEILTLHNHFKHDFLEKNISFGLIRIANINQAVHVAQQIAADSILKDKVKICCYHSQLTTLHRHYIEENLDIILKRGKQKENYSKMDNFVDNVSKSIDKDVIFIVVATSVEEIGRDHDFDWCICEPSSTQSLIQTAGRVNRHREENVSEYNFGILEYNFRAVRGDELIFCKPGLDNNIIIENIDTSKKEKKLTFSPEKRFKKVNTFLNYESFVKNNLKLPDISMRHLIREDLINSKFDASLKFAKNNEKEIHIFSMLDNQFLKNQLENAFKIMNEENLQYHFFNQEFYKYYTLRDKTGIDIFIEFKNNIFVLYYKDTISRVNITLEKEFNNTFLNINSSTRKDRQKIIKNYNYPADSIKLTIYNTENIIGEVEKYHYHPNFGLYKPL